jgi:hypothetical protein
MMRSTPSLLPRGQQLVDLRLAQCLGQAQGLVRGQHAQRGVAAHPALAQGPAKKSFEDGQAPIGRRGTRAGVPGRKVSIKVGLGAGLDRQAAASQPASVGAEVAPVSGQRVGRQTVFKPERIDKGIDQTLGRRTALENLRHEKAAASNRWQRLPASSARAHSSRSLAVSTTFL